MHGSATASEHEAAPDPTERPSATAEAAEPLRLAMERCAARLRGLILSQPPRKLIGYIRAQRMLAEEPEAPVSGEAESDAGLLPLYVHAALASYEPSPAAELDEDACAGIIEAADELAALTRRYCAALAPDDADRSRQNARVAKTSWVSPGHRPATMDAEYLGIVLGPHSEALRQRYGIGAADIIKRLIAIPDIVQAGERRAADAIGAQIAGVGALALERGIAPEETAALWSEEQPELARAAARASAELLEGRVCNLSAHTDLPITLMRDLAYEPGGAPEFFAPGEGSGTPLRTLPARIRPLIGLSGDFFALDPALVVEAAPRALLAALTGTLQREGADFRARQDAASLTAFARLLPEQLRGARIDQTVFYRDPEGQGWAEQDLLIRLDDILIVVDTRAGAAAKVPPQAADFDKHMQHVLATVGGAYQRCRRFCEYLAAAPEVTISRRNGARTVECGRIRLADYRLVLPIGLTQEPFAPFSSMCNALPSIAPILGRHPFMAMSVDDLLVLRSVLPGAQEFFDYMRFRQAALGDKSVPRYFEADLLADYAASVANDVATQPAEAAAEDIAPETLAESGDEALGATAEIDEEDEDATPEPERPAEVAALLAALAAAREPGWRRARDTIRARDAAECESLATALRQASEGLGSKEFNWLYVAGEQPLFVWLQRFATRADIAAIRSRAKAAAIAAGARAITALLVHAVSPGEYSRAVSVGVVVPPQDSAEYAALRADAERARIAAQAAMPGEPAAPRRKIGRNEPCWCGSGRKFKRCHAKQR